MMLQYDDWQNEVLTHRGDLLLCTGRQIGKTTIMAHKAALRMIEKKTEIIIVSLSEDQAKLIINMILSRLEQIAKPMIAKGAKKPTQNKVQLKNGSFALARPVGNTGDALRGFTGDILIIDEASRMPELAFTSAEPTLLTTGGEVWMCSTPYVKQGYFWEQYNAATDPENSEKENEMGWKVMHIDGEQVIMNRPISESWTQEKHDKAIRRLKRLKERWSELHYRQEILAHFVDDIMRFFSDILIEKVCILKRPASINPEGDYFMGNDLARMGGDSFTAEIIQIKNAKTFHHVENIVETKIPLTRNVSIIVEQSAKWNPIKIGIDAGAGSMGTSVLDFLLENPKTKRKVIAMNNRKVIIDREGKSKQKILKEDLYDNLRAMLEQGELLLLDDDSIKASLRSVLVELNEDTFGYSKMHIYGNDTHITEGLTRAAELAKKEKINKLQIYYV